MKPKFRAWNTKNGRFAKDGELFLVIDSENYNLYSVDFDNFHLENDNYILMQSTGLKDKNGVEVYEGDIVNITQYFGGHPYGEIKHIIKRSKYNNNLVADSESGDRRKPEVSMSFRKSDDYEVIGNIYENQDFEEVEVEGEI